MLDSNHSNTSPTSQKKTAAPPTPTKTKWEPGPPLMWGCYKVLQHPSRMTSEKAKSGPPPDNKFSHPHGVSGNHTDSLDFHLCLPAGVVGTRRSLVESQDFHHNPPAISPHSSQCHWRPCKEPQHPPLRSRNEEAKERRPSTSILQ